MLIQLLYYFYASTPATAIAQGRPKETNFPLNILQLSFPQEYPSRIEKGLLFIIYVTAL